jgi:hypothetical protein
MPLCSPERSKRVIIDGVANQFDWYTEPMPNEWKTDTKAVFAGFVAECLRAGPENCALALLADTKEELYDMIVLSIERLQDEPVSVYVNNTVYGVLDYWSVWNEGVFPALYQPAASWYNLANNLAALFQGNATDAFLA